MSTLEKIFNALVLYHYNMKVLHWKVKGLGFDNKHELAANYYIKLDALIDEVAEIMLMIGMEPKNLKTIINNTENDQTEKYLLINCEQESYYTEEQMLSSIREMFEHLILLYNSATHEGNLPEDVVSKLQEHQYYFRLECKYKGKNRMLGSFNEASNVLNEGLKDFFNKIQEQRAKDKEYNSKYKEWSKKAKKEGKAFFPALNKQDVDEFYKIDNQSKVFEKHPKDLKKMYDTVVNNYKNKNYISEQLPIVKYWLQVYKPMYQRLCVNK